jgi:hypothetical protein
MVENGSSTDLYVNNVYIGQFNKKLSNAYITRYGASSNSQSSEYLNGKLDNIRLYQRAITSTEVGLIYNEEKP